MKRTLISGLVLATMTAASAVAAPLDGKGNDPFNTPFDGDAKADPMITGAPPATMERRMICYPLPPEDCRARGMGGLGQDMDPY